MPGFGNSQDLVEIENIRDNTLILRDGSLRQIILVGGINFSLKSEDEQNTLIVSYQNFLNSVDFPLQVLVHSRKINVDRYLEDLERRMRQEPSPLLQNQISEYREFIREFVSENAIMEKSFMVVVPWYAAGVAATGGGLFSGLPFIGRKKDATKEKAAQDENFRENREQLSQRAGQILSGLMGMGLEAVVLKDEELLELFYNFYNPGTTEREAQTAKS